MWEQHVAKKSFYDIKKDRDSFQFDGQVWTYHNSGLARCVYRSKCGNYVIKVPYCSMTDQKDLDRFLADDWKYADPSIQHNYSEAKAYQECPDNLKSYLAKTELLENCWVKQEYVNVFETQMNRHDFREIGQRQDGSWCIFDYDPLLMDFEFDFFRWERLKPLVMEAIQSIKVV